PPPGEARAPPERDRDAEGGRSRPQRPEGLRRDRGQVERPHGPAPRRARQPALAPRREGAREREGKGEGARERQERPSLIAAGARGRSKSPGTTAEEL